MSDFQPERGSEAWDAQMAEQGYLQPGTKAWHRHRRDTWADRPWYVRKRFLVPAGLVASLFLLAKTSVQGPRIGNSADAATSLSSAGLDSAERPMDFDECNRQIRAFADQFGTPDNIVDSSIMRTVRFTASDGSVLITCDAIEAKMIIVKSPNSG